jgi:DNA-binding SARP family transcriptional activator
MEFRILGPLEVVDDGRPVSIRRGKDQELLAYLLLHANEVVPSGRLIDALWDERPPPTAPKILQNAVSHLRKELGEGRLLTRDPGYVLRVEKDELDVQRFEQLAKEGRGKEALALWRGTPLLGLRDERFADDARRRLEEKRLAVLEDRIEDDLAAGRHAELVPEIEELVGENPLRERLQGQLMLALYGAGRQADALDAYRQARKTLSEELGLEPSQQLQELERRIYGQTQQDLLWRGNQRRHCRPRRDLVRGRIPSRGSGVSEDLSRHLQRATRRHSNCAHLRLQRCVDGRAGSNSPPSLPVVGRPTDHASGADDRRRPEPGVRSATIARIDRKRRCALGHEL